MLLAPPCMATSSAPTQQEACRCRGRDFGGYFQFGQYAVWRRYRSAREHRRRVLHNRVRYGRKQCRYADSRQFSSVPTPLAALDWTSGFYGISIQSAAHGPSSKCGGCREHGRVPQRVERRECGVRAAATTPILRNLIYANGARGSSWEMTARYRQRPQRRRQRCQQPAELPGHHASRSPGGNLTLSGSLDTDGANSEYRIEFFANTAGTQDATHGEGRA